MSKNLVKRRTLSFVVLLLIISTQGCARARLSALPSVPTAQDIGQISTEAIELSATSTQQATKTPSPTATTVLPTETSLPKVTITAAGGNLYIRRGPGFPYNQVGVLYKGTSAVVIARDVLSKWVQINIPDSDETGWVSNQSQFSRLNGEFDSLPDFTFTEWPVPAYLYNCTEHDMYIMPGEILITSYFTHPNNQAWLNPGTYTVYDATLPDVPEVTTVNIREGDDQAILVDGSGNHHKCP
jgi:uncharacterized protein YraI